MTGRPGDRTIYPDPPTLTFSICFFVPDFHCFSGAFFLSFPRILRVPQREKPLFFSSFPLLLFPKSKCLRVREWRTKTDKENHIKEFGGWNAPEASRRKIRDVPGTPGTFGLI